MRLATISAAVSVLLTLTFAPAYAGQKGNSGSHGPKTTTTHGPSTAAHGPSAKVTSATTHGPAIKAPSAKPVKVSSPKPTTSTTPKLETKAEKSKKTATTSTTGSTSTKSTSTTSTGGTTIPAIDFTSGSVGGKLSKNSALRSKLETRLTALGYTGTAYQAAYGFKNLGQFVAATNVSRNLGLSFEKLKLQMTGLSVKADGTVLKANVGTDGKVTMVPPALVTNPAPTRSLGQSIQTVKSSVDATAAAQTATTQANAEIQSTTTVSK